MQPTNGILKSLRSYTLVWAPEGRPIAHNVLATCERLAIRKAPAPYCRHRGEIYAIEETN